MLNTFKKYFIFLIHFVGEILLYPKSRYNCQVHMERERERERERFVGKSGLWVCLDLLKPWALLI